MFPRGPEDWGGIFVHEQVRALRRIGIDALVLTGDAKILTRTTLRPRTLWPHLRPTPAITPKDVWGVPTLLFRFLAAYPPWWGYVAAVSYRREVRRLVPQIYARFPFELVHAHTAFLDGGAAAWVARRFKVPFVLTEHTGPFSALTQTTIMRRQTERALQSADLVIAVSDVLRRDMRTRVRMRPDLRIEVLGNAVDTQVFRPLGSEPPADGTVRALWVGGFLPVKQPAMLIDAFALARRHDPRLRLSMVGAGPLERAIQEQIQRRGLEDDVSVLPSASRSAIANHMRRHHFLVISSESETFGLVAVEALACGRPVLSTRCGGPEETVRGSEYGELVRNSVEDLAKGFVTMAARIGEFDPVILHDYVRRNYGFDVIAARVKETYLEVLSRHRSPGRHRG